MPAVMATFSPTGPGEFLAASQGGYSTSAQMPAGDGLKVLCEGPGEEPVGGGHQLLDPGTSPMGRGRL